MATLALLVGLAIWIALTRDGSNYRTFWGRTAQTWELAGDVRGTPYRERWFGYYDETYPFLLYLRDSTPPDARIGLPPRQFIIDASAPRLIPILATATGTYSFIYPRIPSHHGEQTPVRGRLTHLFVWEHWGLERIAPEAVPTESNRYMLYGFGPAPEDAGGR